LGAADEPAQRRAILSALMPKMPLEDGLSEDSLEKLLPKDVSLTGADLKALCENACQNALERCVKRREKGEKCQLKVKEMDFVKAVQLIS